MPIGMIARWNDARSWHGQRARVQWRSRGQSGRGGRSPRTRAHPELDHKKALAGSRKIIGALTKSESGKADAGSETVAEKDNGSTWLSAEELETTARRIAGLSESEEFIVPRCTTSLAIAAFERMFARTPENNTEAAIAVSPAVTTHEAEIEIDHFSTVDDSLHADQGRRAGHLGLAQFTSELSYRSVTIDRDELMRSLERY